MLAEATEAAGSAGGFFAAAVASLIGAAVGSGLGYLGARQVEKAAREVDHDAIVDQIGQALRLVELELELNSNILGPLRDALKGSDEPVVVPSSTVWASVSRLVLQAGIVEDALLERLVRTYEALERIAQKARFYEETGRHWSTAELLQDLSEVEQLLSTAVADLEKWEPPSPTSHSLL